jgi:hypothetical protein
MAGKPTREIIAFSIGSSANRSVSIAYSEDVLGRRLSGCRPDNVEIFHQRARWA